MNETDFNTSHVSINRRIGFKVRRSVFHFNTSHVSINLGFPLTRGFGVIISIHLMFLLIQRFYQLFRFYYISNSLKIPAFSNFFQV